MPGLRAPSVRRKITYRSPVEVSSIIEILDDELEPEPEQEQEPERETKVSVEPQNIGKLI